MLHWHKSAHAAGQRAPDRASLRFHEPDYASLGAQGEALTLCAQYGRIIALGAVFQLLPIGFVPFIRNMVGASFAMAAMIMGFVTNMILDYTFVWVFGWGMFGAAFATILGQAVTMLVSLAFFAVKNAD